MAGCGEGIGSYGFTFDRNRYHFRGWQFLGKSSGNGLKNIGGRLTRTEQMRVLWGDVSKRAWMKGPVKVCYSKLHGNYFVPGAKVIERFKTFMGRDMNNHELVNKGF